MNNKVQCAAGTDSETEEIVWRPPPCNMIQMNWDARLNLKEGCVGLGLKARDSNGTFLVARSMSLITHTEPTSAEALAVVHAIIFARNWASTILFLKVTPCKLPRPLLQRSHVLVAMDNS